MEAGGGTFAPGQITLNVVDFLVGINLVGHGAAIDTFAQSRWFGTRSFDCGGVTGVTAIGGDNTDDSAPRGAIALRHWPRRDGSAWLAVEAEGRRCYCSLIKTSDRILERSSLAAVFLFELDAHLAGSTEPVCSAYDANAVSQ